MSESKLEDGGVKVVQYEYLSDDSDGDYKYEQVPESDDDEEDWMNLNTEETLASIERNVKLNKQQTVRSKAQDARVEGKEEESKTSCTKQHNEDGAAVEKESRTVVRPAVMDDFLRAFLIKLKMTRTLDMFNTEWYELEAKGKLNEEQVGAVPDIYLRNQELDEMVKSLRSELDRMKSISEKAQSTWDKFRKERDFHRLHHKRIVQEKNKMITEIKRLKKHYQTYEPTIKQLREKYELAMKEKMLMKIERDKFAARNDSLELQLQSLENGIEDGTMGNNNSNMLSSTSTSSRESPSKKAQNKSRSITSGPKKIATKSFQSSTRSRQQYAAASAPAGAGEDAKSKLPECDPPNPYLDKNFEAPNVKNLQVLKTFEGHMNAISALAYHPTKQVVATASDDHTWKLWSVPNGDLIMSGEGHGDWVSTLEFNPAGNRLISGSGDGTVKLWDFELAECVATLADHAQPVWGVAWHYSGDFFASCSMDHTARLWDMNRLKVKQTFRGHVDSVNAVKFQPYSSNVCTASGDKTVSMWDSRSGLCIQTFFGHNNACNALALNLRGDTIASCDADGIIKVWDVRMVSELMTLDGGSHALNDVCFDRSGKILAAASDDGTIKMFDIQTGEPISQLKGHDDAVQAVAFDPNSKFFVSAASDKTFRVWKL